MCDDTFKVRTKLNETRNYCHWYCFEVLKSESTNAETRRQPKMTKIRRQGLSIFADRKRWLSGNSSVTAWHVEIQDGSSSVRDGHSLFHLASGIKGKIIKKNLEEIHKMPKMPGWWNYIAFFLAKHAKINTISAHMYKFKMPKKKLENKRSVGPSADELLLSCPPWIKTKLKKNKKKNDPFHVLIYPTPCGAGMPSVRKSPWVKYSVFHRINTQNWM